MACRGRRRRVYASRRQSARYEEPYTGASFTIHIDRIEQMTLVTFELESVAGGTSLTMTECGFDRIPLARRADGQRNQESPAASRGFAVIPNPARSYALKARQAIAKHLDALAHAGLVRSERIGRKRRWGLRVLPEEP